MQQQNVGVLALQSMTTLALALAKLEVGQISIAAIKDGFKLIHDFQQTLTEKDCPYILSQFDFQFQHVTSADTVTARGGLPTPPSSLWPGAHRPPPPSPFALALHTLREDIFARISDRNSTLDLRKWSSSCGALLTCSSKASKESQSRSASSFQTGGSTKT